MSVIDQMLLGKTIILGEQFKQLEAKLKTSGDTRWFFTAAHGYITRQIAKHIKLFRKPNPLMRLNDLFANDYLRAMNSAPHGSWKEAFDACKGLTEVRSSGFVGKVIYAGGGFEVCAACMAKVHINQDLKNALRKVSDVDAQDYGNTLILVDEGHMYAEKMLRGDARGAVSVMGAMAGGDKLRMSAKIWRNQAFEEVYKIKVPAPDPDFARKYQQNR